MTIDYRIVSPRTPSRGTIRIHIYIRTFLMNHWWYRWERFFVHGPCPERGLSFGAPRGPRLIGVAWLKGSPGSIDDSIPGRPATWRTPEIPGSLKRRATRDPGLRYISKSPGRRCSIAPRAFLELRRYWDIDSTRSTSRAISPRTEQARETKGGPTEGNFGESRSEWSRVFNSYRIAINLRLIAESHI